MSCLHFHNLQKHGWEQYQSWICWVETGKSPRAEAPKPHQATCSSDTLPSWPKLMLSLSNCNLWLLPSGATEKSLNSMVFATPTHWAGGCCWALLSASSSAYWTSSASSNSLCRPSVQGPSPSSLDGPSPVSLSIFSLGCREQNWAQSFQWGLTSAMRRVKASLFAIMIHRRVVQLDPKQVTFIKLHSPFSSEVWFSSTTSNTSSSFSSIPS